MQNSVPNVWEVVVPNISIEGRVVHPYVHGLLNGPGQAVFLPAYNFKVLHCCIMATTVLMFKNWRLGLQVCLKSFTKCSSWFSYIFFLTVNPPTTAAVNDTVLLGHNIFILWWHQDVLKCLSSLEVYSYSMFFTYVLYTFTYALCIWNDHVAFLMEYFFVGVCFFFCPWCCWEIFLIAHLGYLHWPSTCSRCCGSFLSNFGVEQMVCALCVKVLITLYLAAKLWLLSHGRYKSVCVGFLYTPMVMVPSASAVMMVSKKGMEPSSLDSSTANWMEGSTVLMCLRNSSLCHWCCITKVSSTYLFHILGGAVLLRWPCSQRLPCRCWPLLDLLVTPWQPLLFVHKTPLERGSRYYSNRTPGALWCY